jgi:hypothetical protein
VNGLERIKKAVLSFSHWAQDNWLALVIFLLALMMSFLFIVMFSWTFGYWANALYGKKFELGSCWQGITVVITGLGGVTALAKAAWTKYGMDSQYNSMTGERPYIRNVPKSDIEMEKK